MKKPQGYKLYVCQTHVKARTLTEARKLAMKEEPGEIWISKEWEEGRNDNLAEAIGFALT